MSFREPHRINKKMMKEKLLQLTTKLLIKKHKKCTITENNYRKIHSLLGVFTEQSKKNLKPKNDFVSKY